LLHKANQRFNLAGGAVRPRPAPAAREWLSTFSSVPLSRVFLLNTKLKDIKNFYPATYS
jgi:hypothetical protein